LITPRPADSGHFGRMLTAFRGYLDVTLPNHSFHSTSIYSSSSLASALSAAVAVTIRSVSSSSSYQYSTSIDAS
jgi:hypothetical protein